MDRFNQLATLRDSRLRGIDRMRAAIGAFGPLHRPLYNPFLKPHNKSGKERWSDEEWASATTIAQRIEADNRAQGESPLSRFADTHLVYRTQCGINPAKGLDRIADGYSFMVGYLDDKEIAGFIHAHPTVNQPNYNQCREHFGRYSGVIKHQTLQYLKLAVKLLIKHSGGKEAWSNASDDDIRVLLLALFDEFPLTISKKTFCHANKSVDFEGIWAGPTGLRTKYQRLRRTKFVHLAKSTYLYCFRTHDRKKLDKVYNRHMKSNGIRSLQIGPIEEMPSRPTPASTQAAV
nr:hypothetical protein B0A51_11993 [Rachicladosporium sp. CCFEE 5018]